MSILIIELLTDKGSLIIMGKYFWHHHIYKKDTHKFNKNLKCFKIIKGNYFKGKNNLELFYFSYVLLSYILYKNQELLQRKCHFHKLYFRIMIRTNVHNIK